MTMPREMEHNWLAKRFQTTCREDHVTIESLLDGRVSRPKLYHS
jgi:hypothetical protein